MVKMLVDTCVWLDLAKDPDQQPLLGVIEELVRLNELSLIVPKTIVDEFNRNKQRILQDSNRSLSSHFKLVKEAVSRFGDNRNKQKTIYQLNDIDHKIPLIGASTATTALDRIENLILPFVFEISSETKTSAAQRAIDQRAPFHRKKNSIGDAILIESYYEHVREKSVPGTRFSFVTHNVHDFSDPSGNNKLPHPDIAPIFSKRRSLFFTSLAEAVHRVNPDIVPDIMLEHEEWEQEPRGLTEILDVERELNDKVWYNRHHNWLYKIESGQHKIVDKVTEPGHDPNVTPRDIYDGARKSARRVEKQYGVENLGPWDDFEWGMINGKLSALRWVLGEDWDELST